MNAKELKEAVARAIRAEWSAFALEHPRLAEMIDEDQLAISLSRSIEDDPEYREAMHTAAEIGAGAEVVSDVVTRLVGRMIRTLL